MAIISPNANPTGAAGGSLTGTYPNPEVAALAILGSMIANETISAGKITNANITTEKLKNEAVIPGKVLPSTLPVAGAENTVVVGVAGISRKIVAAVKGNGVATAFKVKHNLESQAILATILTATFEEPVTLLGKVVAISLSEVEVTFTVAPGAGVVNYIVIQT
jgi:hypothetical protein